MLQTLFIFIFILTFTQHLDIEHTIVTVGLSVVNAVKCLYELTGTVELTQVIGIIFRSLICRIFHFMVSVLA